MVRYIEDYTYGGGEVTAGGNYAGSKTMWMARKAASCIKLVRGAWPHGGGP